MIFWTGSVIYQMELQHCYPHFTNISWYHPPPPHTHTLDPMRCILIIIHSLIITHMGPHGRILQAERQSVRHYMTPTRELTTQSNYSNSANCGISGHVVVHHKHPEAGLALGSELRIATLSTQLWANQSAITDATELNESCETKKKAL
jgi:hypothetical protein